MTDPRSQCATIDIGRERLTASDASGTIVPSQGVLSQNPVSDETSPQATSSPSPSTPPPARTHANPVTQPS